MSINRLRNSRRQKSLLSALKGRASALAGVIFLLRPAVRLDSGHPRSPLVGLMPSFRMFFAALTSRSRSRPVRTFQEC
jgi:hypothetical protein